MNSNLKNLKISEEKGMRKLLSISLVVLVLALLIVSCSPENKTVENNGLAMVSFSMSDGGTRGLTKTDPKLNPDDFYWYYTATKTDGTGLMAGVTDRQKPVTDPDKDKDDTTNGGKGLGNTVGPFSYGDWSFTLYAYATERPTINEETKQVTKGNLAYSGTSEITINTPSSNTLTVVVASKQTENGTGTLVFPLKSAMVEKTTEGQVVDTTKFLEEIEITRVDKTGSEIEKLYNYSTTLEGDNTKRSKTLASGSYKVTFRYIQNATLTYSDGLNDVVSGYTKNQGEYVVGEETIYVAIANYLTTTISGEVESNSGMVTIKVENGKTEVTIPATVNSEQETVFKGEDDNNKEVSKTTFPAGYLAEGTSVLNQTIYAPEVASESGADYLFETEEGEKTSVVGGVDNTLYENDVEKETFGFENEEAEGSSSNLAKRVTQVYYLPKGLNDNKYYKKAGYDGGDDLSGKETSGTSCDITSKYTGSKENYTQDKGYDIPDGEVVYYNPTTGETHFQVQHFSTYYFASPSAIFYNAETNRVYQTLDEAVKDGGTVKLLANARLTVSSCIDVAKALTIDLNGKTLTFSEGTTFDTSTANAIFQIRAPFTVKNGTIEGSVTRSFFRGITNANLTLDNVTAKIDTSATESTDNSGNKTYGANAGKTLVFLYQGSNPVYATIKNSDLSIIGSYCVGSNAKNGAESYINITIENSNIEAKNDTRNENEGKDLTTGLLANVPGNVRIVDSKISGTLQGAILRGGTYTIRNSTFCSTGTNTASDPEGAWSVGNDVAVAALVIGNRGTGYEYPTSVTFEGTNTLSVGSGSNRKHLYIYQPEAATGKDRSVTVIGNIPTAGNSETLSYNEDFNNATVVLKKEKTLYVAGVKGIEDAVASAEEGATIKLLVDLDLSSYKNGSKHGFCFKKGATVDLNKKTITISNNGVYWEGDGLTIKNGKFKALDSDGATGSTGSYALRIGYGKIEAGQLLPNGDLSDETKMQYVATIENVECEGGICVSSHQAIIRGNTKVHGTNYYALQSQTKGKLIVEAGTFTTDGKECGGILLYPGTKSTIDTSVTSGDESIIGYIEIKGGTFGASGEKNVLVNTISKTENVERVKIVGGTFYLDPSNVAFTKGSETTSVSFVAAGYQAVKNEKDSTWTVSQIQAQ